MADDKETQKVNELETVQSVGLTDFIPVLTDEIDNVVGKIKVDDFVNAGYFQDKIDSSVQEQIEPIYNVIYNVIYPIGSIYSGTMAECPIPIGTWELRASKIITDIEDIAPVVGNGIALGVTDGTTTSVLGNYANNVLATAQFYGCTIPTKASSWVSTSQYAIGVTTDPAKSGIEANITKTSLTVNIWERVA